MKHSNYGRVKPAKGERMKKYRIWRSWEAADRKLLHRELVRNIPTLKLAGEIVDAFHRELGLQGQFDDQINCAEQ